MKVKKKKPVKIIIKAPKSNVEIIRRAITRALWKEIRKGNCSDGYVTKVKLYDD